MGCADREVVLAAWAVLTVAIAAFLLGRFPIKGIRIGQLGPGYLGFGAVFLIFGLYFGSGVVGKESIRSSRAAYHHQFKELVILKSSWRRLVWSGDNFPQPLHCSGKKPLCF